MNRSFKNFGDRIKSGEMMQSIDRQTESAFNVSEQEKATVVTPVSNKPAASVAPAPAPVAQAAMTEPLVDETKPEAQKKQKGMSLQLPKDLHDRFTILATLMDVSKRDLALEAIRRLVDEKGREYNI